MKEKPEPGVVAKPTLCYEDIFRVPPDSMESSEDGFSTFLGDTGDGDEKHAKSVVVTKEEKQKDKWRTYTKTTRNL